MSVQIHGFQLPGPVVISGPVINPFQRRIAGNVPPKQIGFRQRYIQHELPTERLSEYDSSIRVRPIVFFNVREQFLAQEGLKLFCPSPVGPLGRSGRVVRASVITTLEAITPIGDSNDNFIRDLVSEIQISLVSHQERK